MNLDSIICVLGWEDRFLEGMKILLQKHEVKTIILISFLDYETMKGMKENKLEILNIASRSKIKVDQISLDYSDSIGNWKRLDTYFTKNVIGNEVMINTTTFPRETIWTMLFFIKKRLPYVRYVYFKPDDYDEKWLTKNHKNPRLLFKHSGIFNLDSELVLFIIPGFDSNRLETMVEFYEPKSVVLFCQDGNQFDNLYRNNGFSNNNMTKAEIILIDSYNINSSIQIFNESIKKYEDSNIIITSQGPKTSAISTYKSYLMSHNRVALAYVPARDFSHNYSVGVDPNYIEGKLDFSYK